MQKIVFLLFFIVASASVAQIGQSGQSPYGYGYTAILNEHYLKSKIK